MGIDTDRRLLRITTAVRLHGWRGRLYFAPVSVLHPLVTRAMASRAAARPPIALRYIKENINRALDDDLGTCLDAEAVAMVRTMATADHREAAAAFVEKRQPTFHGH